MELILDAPNWILALCVLAGVTYAAALYTKDRLNRHFSRGVIFGLSALRFSAVTLIALFLARPLIKTVEQDVEKPVVVIAQDNSSSLALGPDSARYRASYANELRTFAASLAEDYDVQTYTFGEHLSPGLDTLDFSEKTTDYTALLDELYATYSNRNLGAVVVASDGRYNRGVNPVYSFQKLNAPVYTIALGDTAARRDVQIAEVAHNRLAYLGNRFPVEVRVEGFEVPGESATVTIARKGQALYSEVVKFDGPAHSQVVRTTLETEETGLQQYVVSVSVLDQEVTTANNREAFFIDVLDSRQKVLLLHRAPHPDVKALRYAMASNANYEVQVATLDDFDGEVTDYNLVVFHGLPNGTDAAALAREAAEGDVPAWYIWTSSTLFREFNNLGTGAKLTGGSGKTTDAGAEWSDGFTLFTLSESTQKRFRNYPPLTLPFGNLDMSPGMSPMLFQRVGQIKTEQPLLAFNTSQGRKLAVTTGEGLWRWRLFDYLEDGNHAAFDEWVTKTVQYLAAKDDKSQFRVAGETDLLENQAVRFEAELYNDAYEPINSPEVTMTLTSEEGNTYDRVFTRAGDGYRLDAGSLPVGQYSYQAQTQLGGKTLTERGEFSISPIQLELTETRADHALMFNFAQANGGEMVDSQELGKLEGLVRNSGNVQSVIHESRVLSDLINTPWLLYLIVGLLALEWLWRKRNGTY